MTKPSPKKSHVQQVNEALAIIRKRRQAKQSAPSSTSPANATPKS